MTSSDIFINKDTVSGIGFEFMKKPTKRSTHLSSYYKNNSSLSDLGFQSETVID